MTLIVITKQEKSFNEIVIERDYETTGKCRMTLAKNDFYKVYQGFILPKQSPLKPIIDRKYVYILIYLRFEIQQNLIQIRIFYRFLQMIESGLIEYWRRRLWPFVKQCDPAYQKYGPRRLDLDSFQSPFLIWGIGSALALVAFVTENVTFYFISK